MISQYVCREKGLNQNLRYEQNTTSDIGQGGGTRWHHGAYYDHLSGHEVKKHCNAAYEIPCL